MKLDAATAIPLVGRTRELAALQRAVHRILLDQDGGRRGSGDHICLVTGEPGIGKTRLIAEQAAYAASRGVEVLADACHERGDPPLAPFRSIVPRAARGLGLEPEVRAAAESLAAAPDPEGQGIERPVLLDHLATVLLEAARARPLLVQLDDIHWAGPEAVDLLKVVARRLKDQEARLLVVATVRSTDLADTALERALAELRPEETFRELRLHRLGEASVARMVETRLGASPSPAFLRALMDQTRGNPFHVEEVLRALSGNGELALRGGRIELDGEVRLPASVQEALGRRLATLSAPATDVLRLLSGIERAVPVGLLAEATGLPPEGLYEALTELAKRGFVAEEGEGEALHYRPDHPLVAAAVFAGLDEESKAGLHRRLARALESFYGEGVNRVAAEVADQYEHAGEDRPFVVFGLAAASAARQVCAHEQAAVVLGRVVETCSRRGRWRREHLQAVAELADTLRRTGRYEEAIARVEAALEQGLAARPREEAELRRLLAEVHLSQGDLLKASFQLSKAYLMLGRARAPRERGAILLAMGRLELWRGRYRKALVRLDAARRLLAGAKSQQPLLATAHHECSLVLHFLGQPAEALWRLREALALSGAPRERGPPKPVAGEVRRTLGDARGVLIPWRPEATAFDFGVDLEAAAAYYRERRALYERVGDAQTLALAENNLGVIAHARGRYGEALDAIGRTIEIERKARDRRGTALAMHNLACLYLSLGKNEEAEALLLRARSLARSLGSQWLAASAQRLLGRNAVAQGRFRRASTRLTRAMAVFQRLGNLGATASICADLARLAWRRGDRKGALELCGRVLSRANPMSSRIELVDALAVVARVASAAGSREQAQAAMDGLRVQVEAMDLDPETWRFHVLGGLIAEEAGDPGLAAARFRQALPAFRRMLDSVPSGLRGSFLADEARVFFVERVRSGEMAAL